MPDQHLVIPISFGTDTIIQIREEIHTHLVKCVAELQDAFAAFEGKGFKITFTVKVDRDKSDNTLEIDMKFDPLPKAHYRRTAKVSDWQQNLFGGLADKVEVTIKGAGAQEGKPVDTGTPEDWNPDIEGEPDGGPVHQGD